MYVSIFDNFVRKDILDQLPIPIEYGGVSYTIGKHIIKLFYSPNEESEAQQIVTLLVSKGCKLEDDKVVTDHWITHDIFQYELSSMLDYQKFVSIITNQNFTDLTDVYAHYNKSMNTVDIYKRVKIGTLKVYTPYINKDRFILSI